MSPISRESELGRVIAIRKALEKLLTKINTIIQLCSSNTNILTIRLKVKLLVANIERVNTLRTDYLQLAERDRQDFNEELNSIDTIITSRDTIKNFRVNSQTLNSLTHNLRNLSQQITTAIVQVANLVSILDTRDRIALASSSRPSRPTRFPSISSRLPSPGLSLPPPPPFSAPPMLQRRPNIGTQPTSLVRQQAMHLSLDDLDLTPSRTSSNGSSINASGKKYLRARKITHRKRGAKKPKTRRK